MHFKEKSNALRLAACVGIFVGVLFFFGGSPHRALADGWSNCSAKGGACTDSPTCAGKTPGTLITSYAKDKTICDATNQYCCNYGAALTGPLCEIAASSGGAGGTCMSSCTGLTKDYGVADGCTTPTPACCVPIDFCDSPTSVEVVPGFHGLGGTCRSACQTTEKDSGASLSSSGCPKDKSICCLPTTTAPTASAPGEVRCGSQVVKKTDDPNTVCPLLAKWKDIDILKDSTTCGGAIAYTVREEYRAMYAALNCDSVGKTPPPKAAAPSEPRQVQLPDQLGGVSLLQVIGNVIRVFMGTVGAFTLLVFTFAGVMYLFSAGDASRVAKAKETMKYAAIGLILIIGAYAITTFIVSLAPAASSQPILIQTQGGGV